MTSSSSLLDPQHGYGPISTLPDLQLLDSLASGRSRASTAAIGHDFVLNGSPSVLGIVGLDALGDMVCDWTVAILEEAINTPGCRPRIRRHALMTLYELVMGAIERGYQGLTKEGCRRFAIEAKKELAAMQDECHFLEIRAVEDLCNHLSQAVESGFFGQLPDF